MIFTDLEAHRRSGFAPKVCIVGSGPAGLALALKLEQRKIPCLIVEAGKREYDADVQDAYRGTVVGDRYYDLAIARLRQFGGSSNHWGGWCRQMEAIDFQARPAIVNSGWPIRKADLDPYARETESILEIDIPGDKPLSDQFVEIHLGFSPPVRFGTKYAKHIEASQTVGLLLDTPLVDIHPVKDRIESIGVRTKDGKNHTITAPYIAICTGGIENSRVLLAANARHRNGVVPDARALGRYWMEHPHSHIGDALIFSFTEQRADRGMRFFAPTVHYLEEQRVGNFQVRMLIGEKLSKALVRDAMCHAPQLIQNLTSRLHDGSMCSAQLHLAWEQVPLRENRIELDTETDRNGVPRTKLYWRQTEAERRTAASAVALTGSYFATHDVGRVKIAPWLQAAQGFSQDEDQMAGFHHMGGTRMATTSENGVVDGNCKVFGVDNLFVGGSSVFPTSGHANPTYSIVQLALRLGDHLAERVQKS